MHQNLLQFRRGRYFWVALALLIFSLIVYASQRDTLPPNGGSWQGYTLGGIAAALILWLAALGVRKRRYRSQLGTVEGWTSAHVYLGTALLLIALLHCSFQFGWNVHTLLFALMTAVIISGFVGLILYMVYPRRLARVRAGKGRQAWLAELNELDGRARDVARGCAASMRTVAESAVSRTSVGGGAWAQLRGADHSKVFEPSSVASQPKLVSNRDQQTVIDYIAAEIPKGGKAAETQIFQDLLTVFGRRRTVLRKLREDIRLQAWLQVWLYIHVPLTIAAIAALIVHVSSVFLYF